MILSSRILMTEELFRPRLTEPEKNSYYFSHIKSLNKRQNGNHLVVPTYRNFKQTWDYLFNNYTKEIDVQNNIEYFRRLFNDPQIITNGYSRYCLYLAIINTFCLNRRLNGYFVPHVDFLFSGNNEGVRFHKRFNNKVILYINNEIIDSLNKCFDQNNNIFELVTNICNRIVNSTMVGISINKLRILVNLPNTITDLTRFLTDKNNLKNHYSKRNIKEEIGEITTYELGYMLMELGKNSKELPKKAKEKLRDIIYVIQFSSAEEESLV